MKNTVLLVDDEDSIISSLRRTLIDEPYKLFAANSAEEALAIFGAHRIKVVISDERMPGMGGAQFLSIVRRRFPETVRIMLTGYASVESTMKAVNCGEIYRFFTKPWNDTELILALRSAIEKYDLELENKRLLKTVKRQSQELKVLEQKYPGITAIEKDERGRFALPEVSDDELEKIIAAFNEEYS